MKDAKVSIMTHAFMYGTATFEGIRAYWNEEQGKLYGLKLREHVERIRQSCRILLMDDIPSVDELSALIIETVRRNGFREDCYIRPSFYKSTRAIGVRLHDLDHELYIIALPFGNYIDTDKGVRLMTSSWRRNADDALPARGKIVGGYVNMAFQKSEAELNGYDEAVVLTANGHVNESSAANIYIVRDGVAITPPVNDDLLEGVTRKGLMELLANEGIPVLERSINRTELYVADEIFVCGTGVQISPVIEVDHRKVGVGRGRPDRQARARPLLRRRPRAAARIRALADPDRVGPGPGTFPPGRAPVRRSGRGGGSRSGVSRPITITMSVRTLSSDRRLDRDPEQLLEIGDRLGQRRLRAVVDGDHRVGRDLALGLLARRRGREAVELEVPGQARPAVGLTGAVEHPDAAAFGGQSLAAGPGRRDRP